MGSEISRDQLVAIYNPEIESWKDLGGPDEPIAAIGGDGGRRVLSLARTLYLYTDGEPDGNERDFLEFVTGERGQAIAEDLGFVPVR